MQGHNRTLSTLVSLLILMGLACSFSAAEKHSKQEGQKTDRLNKIIAEHFPEYSIIQTKDIDNFFTDPYEKPDIGDSPGVVQADFNGDEIDD